MKKIVLLFGSLFLFVAIQAQRQQASYLAYIEEWKDVAIQQQQDFGIPASITMAQALLESGAGQSELATQAHNHFGIKCTSEWFGGVYYHDDETAGECFRQYRDAGESFKDHSLFLQRPRYTTCFEIAVEDYEGWANRLRECGYATDKNYGPKLIKIIEDYRLDTLTLIAMNKPVQAESVKEEPVKAEPVKEEVALQAAPTDSVTAEKPVIKTQQQKRPLKATIVHRTDPIMVIHNDPEPPYVEPLTAKQERDSFFLMHPKKRYNNVLYVTAREGDTYANVAFRLNVRERDLREDNDALGRELQKGDRIYLTAKKTNGVADKPFVWTHTGQSLWQLSQDEAVTIESILKYNELLDPTIRTFRTRQKIYLRKVKEENNARF